MVYRGCLLLEFANLDIWNNTWKSKLNAVMYYERQKEQKEAKEATVQKRRSQVFEYSNKKFFLYL